MAFERVELEPGERADLELQVRPNEIGLFERSSDERTDDGTVRLSVADQPFDLEVRPLDD